MYTANLAAFTTGYAHLMRRGVEWGVEGSGLEMSMDEESQVRGCYNITFYLYTNQETVSVGKDTSKQSIQNMKANVKSKEQQLSNKYSNHVVYL